jgi:hypothetical protein
MPIPALGWVYPLAVAEERIVGRTGFVAEVESAKVAGQHSAGAAQRAEATAQRAMHCAATDGQAMRQVGPHGKHKPY